MRKTIMPVLLLLTFCFGLFCAQSYAQVTISGPACITTGTTYQYNITGKWDSATSIQACVMGGIIVDSGKSCINTKLLSFLRIEWDANGMEGTINLTTTSGNASLKIKITRPLKAGGIENKNRNQILNAPGVPAVLYCSEATGGNCTPSYLYQWQYSDDNLQWIDFPETSRNLSFKSSINTTTYFRRRVTENSSGTAAFSEPASIIVITAQ